MDYYSRFFEIEQLHTITSQQLSTSSRIYSLDMEYHKLSSTMELSFHLSCLATIVRYMPSLTRPPALNIPNQMVWLKNLFGLPNVCLPKTGKVKVIFHFVYWNTETQQFVIHLHQPNFLWVAICTQFYQ